MIIEKQWNNFRAIKRLSELEEAKNISTIEHLCPDSDYLDIRKELKNRFDKSTRSIKNSKRKDYMMDLLFGVKLYDYFTPGNDIGFTLDMAEDQNFWSYLSLMVIPDVVCERWGGNQKKKDRFYSKKTRIWLSQIWWYIHFSFQNNLYETEEMLKRDAFNTDTILQLVDRTGAKGTIVELNRQIMHEYAKRSATESYKGIDWPQVFRRVMKLNTAKIVLFEPSYYCNGIKGYVDSLFSEALEGLNESTSRNKE